MDGEPSEPLAQAVVVQAPKPSRSRKLWLYITKRDLEKYGYTAGCPACDGCRLGEEAQEFTTVTCVVRELRSALGRRKTILVLWNLRHAKTKRQHDRRKQLEYQFQRYFMAIKVNCHMEHPNLAEFGQEKIKMLLISKLLWQKDLSGRTWFGELRERSQIIRSLAQELLRKKKAVSGICHCPRSRP